MTYTEIIDNIQTRIENLISERFSGTYTNIQLTATNYNPNIDTNTTITITVTDQNDDPITNWTVPLQINGTEPTTPITTDNTGTATYTYTCNDWGTVRFQVKTASLQIQVGGYRTTSLGNATIYYNNHEVRYDLHFTASANFTSTTWANVGTVSAVPTDQLPPQSLYTTTSNQRLFLRINGENGRLQYQVSSTVTNPSLYLTLTWKY